MADFRADPVTDGRLPAMLMYVVRHAKAEADTPTEMDFDRPLRAEGLRQVAYLVEEFTSVSTPPALVITSPTVRAVQTASPIARALGVDLVEDDRLRVDEPVSPLLDLIDEHLGSASVAVVGHNPQLERLVGTLVHAMTPSPVRLRTGEVLMVEFVRPEPGAATIIDAWRMEGN